MGDRQQAASRRRVLRWLGTPQGFHPRRRAEAQRHPGKWKILGVVGNAPGRCFGAQRELGYRPRVAIGGDVAARRHQCAGNGTACAGEGLYTSRGCATSAVVSRRARCGRRRFGNGGDAAQRGLARVPDDPVDTRGQIRMRFTASALAAQVTALHPRAWPGLRPGDGEAQWASQRVGMVADGPCQGLAFRRVLDGPRDRDA